MKESTKKMIEQCDEIVNFGMKEGMDFDTYMSMNEKDINFLIKTLRLYKASKNYLTELSEQLDRIEEKLDKLLVEK